MDNRNEVDRIASSNNLTTMPANPWEFDVDLGLSHNDAILRVLSVVREIASHNPTNWPSDEEWRAALPGWLNDHMPEMTKEETDELLVITPRDQWNTLPWEFGSWVYAVRDRGWRWWGYKQLGSSATLVLHIGMFPERRDAFKEILRAAGIKIVTERYVALSNS